MNDKELDVPPLVNASELRALAVSTKKRSGVAPAGTPEAFYKDKGEVAKWRKVVQSAGIHVD